MTFEIDLERIMGVQWLERFLGDRSGKVWRNRIPDLPNNKNEKAHSQAPSYYCHLISATRYYISYYGKGGIWTVTSTSCSWKPIKTGELCVWSIWDLSVFTIFVL